MLLLAVVTLRPQSGTGKRGFLQCVRVPVCFFGDFLRNKGRNYRGLAIMRLSASFGFWEMFTICLPLPNLFRTETASRKCS